MDALDGIAVDAALKASALLIAVGGLAFLGRRTSAGTRHLLWSGALAACLALPLLGPLLPVVAFKVPAPTEPRLRQVIRATAAPLSQELPAAVEAPAQAAVAPRTPAASAQLLPRATSAPAVPSRPPPRAGDPDLLRRALWSVWMIGAAIAAAWTLIGHWVVRRLARAALEIEDERQALVARLARSLGIRRTVRALESSRIRLPATWGVLRPVVLLPRESSQWPRARLELVLLHELAHVKRFDALTQLVAQVARAVYWFHPLVWWAEHRARILREYASDDAVLRAGTRPSRYAEEILHLVRDLGATWPASGSALSMARPSEVEARLRAILDPRRARGGLTRGRRALAMVASASLLLPLAAMRPAWAAEDPQAATPTRAGALPRLSRDESERRRVRAGVPAAPPAAPTPPTPPAPPLPPTRPVPPVAPVPPLPPSRSHHVHVQGRRAPSDEGQDARALFEEAGKAASDADLAAALLKVADAVSLSAPADQEKFLALLDRIKTDSLRARVLRRLLADAPISEHTGREVLRSASVIRDPHELARVLQMMHEIHEADLVRGPLANDYLNAAEQLKAPDELSDVLTSLLRPERLSKEATARALKLAERVELDAERLRILRQVTDFQVIDREIEDAYRGLAKGMRDAGARDEALERLTDALKDGNAHPRVSETRSGSDRFFAWHLEGGEHAAARSERDRHQAERDQQEAERDRQEEARDREQAARDREAERGRREALRESQRAQHAELAERHRQMSEGAEQLRAQARQFAQELRERTTEFKRHIQEQLKRGGLKGIDVDNLLEEDGDGDVNGADALDNNNDDDGMQDDSDD